MPEFVDYATPLPCGCSLKDGRCTSHGYMTRVIRLAHDNHVEDVFSALWAIQDGYGEPGIMPSQGWDWSGIRDSTTGAIEAMFRWVVSADRWDETTRRILGEAAEGIAEKRLRERAQAVRDAVLAAQGHNQ